MLLAIDVGNTNTVLGLFAEEAKPADQHGLRHHWRISTTARTADEYAILLKQLLLLGESDARPEQIHAAILSSVVPSVSRPVVDALSRYFGVTPLLVGPGVKSGMPILAENPKEVGADRIVNAVGAYHRHRSGLIVVDFGTATTFDCVSPQGAYLGGAICPGIEVSADALYRHAAKLPRVPFVQPSQVIGRDTVSSMQAGLYFGYVGLVDGLVRRLLDALQFPARVVATGGLAREISAASQTIEEVDELLTLSGLRIIYYRNQT